MDCQQKSICLIIPSYNESSTLEKYLPKVVSVLDRRNVKPTLLIVNDLGQPDSCLEEVCSFSQAALINTPKNMGSQQAILYGIRQQVSHYRSDIILVMDGDGQDDAQAIPDIMDAVTPNRIVVAQRVGKRPEGLIFNSLYRIYKGLFRLLTGITPDFGNFSAYDQSVADRIAGSPHFKFTYSMALPHLCPIQRVPVKRLKRLSGDSKVGYKGLFRHAVRSSLPHLNVIGIRIMTGSVALLLISILFLSVFRFENNLLPIVLFIRITAGLAALGVILSLCILYIHVILKRLPSDESEK